MASAGKDNLLALVALVNLTNLPPVTALKVEAFCDETILCNTNLFGVSLQRFGVRDIIGRGGDDDVGPSENSSLERPDNVVHQPLCQDVGVPMQHDLCLLVHTRAYERIDKGIGAMHMHGIGAFLPQYLAENLAIGESHILTHEREVHRYAIDFYAVYVFFAVHAVGSKADNHIAVCRHPLGQIHGYGLYAAQVGIVVFGYV